MDTKRFFIGKEKRNKLKYLLAFGDRCVYASAWIYEFNQLDVWAN